MDDEQVGGAEALAEGQEQLSELVLETSRHVNSPSRERQRRESQSSCLMLGGV